MRSLPQFRFGLRWLVLVMILLPFSIYTGWRWRAISATNAEIRAIRLDQLKAAQAWYTAVQSQWGSGLDWHAIGQDVSRAIRAIRDAELEVAVNHSERVQARQKYVASCQSRFRKVDALHQVGAAGGEAEEHAEALYELRKAEAELKQEERDR